MHYLPLITPAWFVFSFEIAAPPWRWAGPLPVAIRRPPVLVDAR